MAPSHALASREGAGEALDRGTRRLGYRAPKLGSRGADALTERGRQHRRRRFREPSADLAGSENLCMRGVSMRENREVPRSLAPS